MSRYGRQWELTWWQALEGKDVKDLLSNVGSGGGGAAPVGGAAGGGDAPAEAAKEEAKEEGMTHFPLREDRCDGSLTYRYREGGVRRGYGLRSLRLNEYSRDIFLVLSTDLHGRRWGLRSGPDKGLAAAASDRPDRVAFTRLMMKCRSELRVLYVEP